MRSTSRFDATPQPAPRHGATMISLAALALVACTSDEVSLGGGDGPAGGSGACALGVGGVVEGDVRADAQGQLDELAGCSGITGSLNITATSGIDLAPLASLRWVRGRLDIQARDAPAPLESLEGLEGLERVGELFLVGLDITSVAPLRNLTAVSADPVTNPWGFGTIYISDCNRLIDLAGLENLVVWDEFYLVNVASLESLRGLVTHRENQRLDVSAAPSLRDTASVEWAAHMESIRFVDTGIRSFDLNQTIWLHRIELANNPALVSVEGLRPVEGVDELVIRNNDRLEQLPELPYLDYELAVLSIQDNDALRSIPAWINPDDGNYLAPENLGQSDAPAYFFPPEFSMAEITGNSQLTTLALPTSFRFGGNVRIHDNPNLATIDMSFVDSLDDLSIANNPALSQVGIPVLQTVDHLHVMNNQNLPASVFENVRSFSTEMQGNLEATAP